MLRRTSLPFFLLVLLAVTLLPACDSALDDEQPVDNVPRDQAFASVENAQAVLLGAYSTFQFTGSYGGSAYMAADFTTSNVAFGGSFQTFQQLQNFNVLSTNGSVGAIYDDPYDGTNRANDVIANAPGIPDLSEDGQQRVMQFVAEAKFIRALHYHNLVRYFAMPWNVGGNNDQPGVPIRLDPSVDPNEIPELPRASVAEVYSQINTDLNDAISTFENIGGPGVAGRADLGAAQALQARVHLYQGRYQSAADLATEVINSPDYMLVADIVQAFGESNSTEDIFAVQNNSSDNSGTNDFPTSFYLPSSLGGRGDLTMTPQVLSIYNDSLDARQADLIYAVPNPGNPVRQFDVSDAQCAQLTCWTHKFRSDAFADNIRVIRLAEMYLTRAEANARMDDGDEAQALADLNRIRTRAGLPAFDSVDDIGDGDDNDSASNESGSLLEEIILERRRELAFEGDYRHDLVRRGAPLTAASGAVAPEFQRILPIPSAFLDANSLLVQNPGY